MQKRKVTMEIIQEINKLYNSGLKIKEISPKFNLSNSTVGEYIHKPRHHGSGRIGPRKVSDKTIQLINKLYDNGEVMKNIGIKLNLSTTTIWKYVESVRCNL